MEWQTTDAQSLGMIDQEIGEHTFSPSEYEIIRRVIYATADFDYKSLIRFSEQALQAGAAALAARTTVVVDHPMVQVGISPTLQSSFGNPIYCSLEALTRRPTEKTPAASGMAPLAHRYPEAIFVIGVSQTALTTLMDLIEAEAINPALVVATPPNFINPVAQERLRNSWIPHLRIEGRKGNAGVATAMVNSLADLAWQAYGQPQTLLQHF